MKRQYIGISRDHSGSMAHLASYAQKDYNDLLNSIKNASTVQNIPTWLSVVECGRPETPVNVEKVNVPINTVQPMYIYPVGGNTPLFDSIGKLIETLESTPDAHDPEVSFLVMVITDGEENASIIWRNSLNEKIAQLQRTNRWSFTFRVPKGYAVPLSTTFGVPRNNIIEWEQTIEGITKSSVYTMNSMETFYAGRAMGATATMDFYSEPKKDDGIPLNK